MARRLIGTGTTDSNGKVSVTYTGAGAGKIQIVAESGSLLSETYELIDGTVMDRGTSTDHNDSLWNNTDWFTRGDDSTSVNYTNTGSAVSRLLASRISYTSEFAIEFDLSECTFCRIRVPRYGSSNAYTGTPFSSNGHVQIKVLNSKTEIYLDGTKVTEENTNALTEFTFEFRAAANETLNFKFKNFVIYPI